LKKLSGTAHSPPALQRMEKYPEHMPRHLPFCKSYLIALVFKKDCIPSDGDRQD